MSILAENIKLYNPLNNKFLLYNSIILIALFSIFPFIADDLQRGTAKTLADNNLPFLPVLFFFYSVYDLGAMFAIMQADIMTKPFSACLPALHKISARFVLFSGLILNLIYLALFLYLPSPTKINGPLYYIFIFTGGLLLYFVAAYFTFYIQHKRERVFITLLITVFLFCLISFLVMRVIKLPFDFRLFYAWVIILILCLLVIFALLKMLANPDYKRSLILNDSLFNLNFSSQTTAQIRDTYKLRRLSFRDEKEDPFIGRLILKQLDKLPSLSLIKSIATKLLYKLDRFSNCNKHHPIVLLAGIFFIISIFIILSGYHAAPITNKKAHGSFMIFLSVLGPLIFSSLGFIYLYLFAGVFLNPDKNNLLFPEGRSEHFCSSLIIWLLKPVTIVAWLSLAILIAKVFKYYIPGFTLAGVSFNYIAPGFSMILWVLLIIPVMDIFMFNTGKQCGFITALIYLAVLLALSLYSIFGVDPFYASSAMALAIVISNGFFIVKLWRYWFKKDIELLD